MIDITKVPEIRIAYVNPIPVKDRIKITQASEMADLMFQWWHKFMPDSVGYVESFVIAMLNKPQHVLGARCIGVGGISGLALDIRVVAQHAIKANASYVILCHNHPSGNPDPSDQDKNLTREISKALGVLNIEVLDHIIITPDPKVFHSFCENGPGI